ncbi:MAG: cupin domain-containing protein [Acetobacteraceae bacterium]|nr:cupin domain-containing protein [Acetobacteraceae bacterium]
MPERPIAIRAAEAPPRTRPSAYPVPELAAKVAGRAKRPLGDLFGLTNFGVNLTRLPPGSASALRHAHARQDEFVYVLEGEPVLVTDAGETRLSPGMCAGFAAGTGDAHHLLNRGPGDAVFLEVGDRAPGESVAYPDDDLRYEAGPDGRGRYSRKDGTPVGEDR